MFGRFKYTQPIEFMANRVRERYDQYLKKSQNSNILKSINNRRYNYEVIKKKLNSGKA